MKSCTPVLYLLGARWCWAAPLGRTDAASEVWQMLWALLVVLGLVFAAAWIIRKSRMLPGASSSGIRIVAQQWLSTRERLLLVEVGKEQVLIGVSPQGMVLLHQLDEPVPVDDQTTDTGGKRFASELQRLLGKSDPRNPESPT